MNRKIESECTTLIHNCCLLIFADALLRIYSYRDNTLHKLHNEKKTNTATVYILFILAE